MIDVGCSIVESFSMRKKGGKESEVEEDVVQFCV
jgi:hypothetical protein